MAFCHWERFRNGLAVSLRESVRLFPSPSLNSMVVISSGESDVESMITAMPPGASIELMRSSASAMSRELCRTLAARITSLGSVTREGGSGELMSKIAVLTCGQRCSAVSRKYRETSVKRYS